MTERMRSTLVRLPKISILRPHVRFHGPSDNCVAKVLKVLVVFASHGTKLGLDQFRSCFLEHLEQRKIFHTGHFDDLPDAVTYPTFVKRFPKVPVGKCQYGRMVDTVQIFVAVPVAAGAWGRACVDSGYDGGTQHNVRCVPVVQARRETTNVGDYSTTDDENRFISRHTVLLHFEKNLFHVLHVLVYLVSGVYQFDELDVIRRKILRNLFAEITFYFIVDDGYTSPQRTVDFCQDLVVGI
mmetsp:Transcript_49786/g.56329  ORF Transcript_49786/g.56329 Transcript_49786/m.56329 type:complete len:240 (+) Transcript_49786:108-827(+)